MEETKTHFDKRNSYNYKEPRDIQLKDEVVRLLINLLKELASRRMKLKVLWNFSLKYRISRNITKEDRTINYTSIAIENRRIFRDIENEVWHSIGLTEDLITVSSGILNFGRV